MVEVAGSIPAGPIFSKKFIEFYEPKYLYTYKVILIKYEDKSQEISN